MSTITFAQIQNDPDIRTYIQQADASLAAMGYTEHSFAHVGHVAGFASKLLLDLGYDAHQAELARIAGYMHDIGNVVNRVDHAHSGAIMAFRLLDKLGMPAADLATVITAIGNHDERTAFPVNAVAAALILADKTDVRRSRVRPKPRSSFDRHDRVNYSVTEGRVALDRAAATLTAEICLDTDICSVMEYFEIFMERMLLCRKAANFFGVEFHLNINAQSVV